MPTKLPVRVPPKREPSPVPAWIAGILAFAVMVGLTIRAPLPCEIASDGGGLGSEQPQRYVRVVMAHSAPLTLGVR